jgi:carboxymethylenebutenolidase
MTDRDAIQRYLVEEFYDDYREGLITRRTFIRRIAYITGGVASAIPVMTALGCAPEELPDPTEPIPAPDTAVPPTPAAEPTAVPTATSADGPQSPLSVAEDDPDVSAGVVTFSSGEDTISGYLARPAAEGSYPAVLVCHENRGLNPHIEDVARRFAKAGYVALTIDLLSREGGTAAFDRDEVPGLLNEAGPERHVADFAAGFDYLQSLPEVEDERIGMNGYCFGGGITWRSASAIEGLKAAVPFYGPAPDLATVPGIQAAVLGVYAELDDRVNASKDALEQALADAGVTHEMKVYPGVDHAFHNDTGQRYVQDQAIAAWNDMMAWFEKYL